MVVNGLFCENAGGGVGWNAVGELIQLTLYFMPVII